MRTQRFSFLCSEDERGFITALAEHLHRSQSDAVRFIIVNAVRELETSGELEPFIKSLQPKREHDGETR